MPIISVLPTILVQQQFRDISSNILLLLDDKERVQDIMQDIRCLKILYNIIVLKCIIYNKNSNVLQDLKRRLSGLFRCKINLHNINSDVF